MYYAACKKVIYLCLGINFFDFMEHSFILPENLSKKDKYDEFARQYAFLIEGESDSVAVMANTAAALKEAFGFFWVGFYMVKGEELVLGPFQGSVACYRIKYGRGVCGTAWAQSAVQIVADVDSFPGHIACSSLSRSEIVVPLVKNGKVIGVLDIDSDRLNAFDETDRVGLEKVMDEMLVSFS